MSAPRGRLAADATAKTAARLRSGADLLPSIRVITAPKIPIRIGAILGLALGLACNRDGRSAEGEPASAPNGLARGTGADGDLAGDLSSDDRIAWLLAPCAHREPFLADTGDPVAILVSKLERGQLDPLRQAKTELAQMGEAALPELRRLAERALRDPRGAQTLLNVLAVVGAMETDAGRDLLVAAIGHPQDTVRTEAVRGLSRHARPEDYDRLMALAPISASDTLSEIGAALGKADRARMEDDFLAWLRSPREHAGMWIGAPERVAETNRAEIIEQFREIYPHSEGEIRYYLAGAVAKTGDEKALAFLQGALKADNLVQRTLAVRALVRVGLTREIVKLLWEDREETLRGIVAGAIAAMPPTAETAGWLRRGSLDRARSVRLICLAVLAARGDVEARDQGLTMLEGGRGEIEYGLKVLREAMEKDPDLAARALDVLERLRAGVGGPVRAEPTTIDRAIGQIPIVAAARSLYDRARTTRGVVEGMSAHRWYLMNAGNSGPAGRTWLRDRWEEEEDPAWRVDIAMAGSYDKDDQSRQFLLAIVDDERATPLEVLHAANLVVHQGPAAVVAPRLKRAALRCDDPQVRPALNCLLWQWYGQDS